MAPRTVSLVAMGYYARHYYLFKSRASNRGEIGDHNIINCDLFVPPLKRHHDYTCPDHQAHGDNPDIIASIIAKPEFVQMCDELVQRFLVPDDPLPVIVLMDNCGKHASWVMAKFMKDVLNSMKMGDGTRRFNAEAFVMHEVCDQWFDNSRVHKEFNLAKMWLSRPWHCQDPPEYRRQYAVEHLADRDDGVSARAKSRMSEVRMLVATLFHERQTPLPDVWPDEWNEPTLRTDVAPSTPPEGPAHRSSESVQASQATMVDGPADRSSELAEEERGDSPQEHVGFRAPGVVDSGAGEWYEWNQRQYHDRPPWHAPTTDHRTRGNTDHRTGDMPKGKGKGTDKGKGGKGKRDNTFVAEDNSEDHNAKVADKRKELIDIIDVRETWKTFDQDITVWFPLLQDLYVDDRALNHLRELTHIMAEDWPNPPRPVGYFAANALIHKVLTKHGQKIVWNNDNPSAFISQGCWNATNKIQGKRKAPPKGSGYAQYQQRPSKGSKNRR